jgi:hypothetical protein
MCDRCLIEVYDEEQQRWVGILHHGEPPADVTRAHEQILAETKTAAAKAKLEKNSTDEEPVESCPQCGAVVGHAADCSRKGA